MELNITYDEPINNSKRKIENEKKEDIKQIKKIKIEKDDKKEDIKQIKKPIEKNEKKDEKKDEIKKISRKYHPITKTKRENIIRGNSKPFQTHKSDHIYSNGTFDELGLDKSLCEYLNDENGINLNTPTFVQQKSIPIILSGSDTLVKSETGSGKTLCYLLPILHNLLVYLYLYL